MGVTVVAVLMVGAVLFALTSAWYTNTIQTNDISLKTAQWNFKGAITLGNEANGALDLGDIYPGDSRVLPLTIENSDNLPVDIRAEADKTLLSEELQKRIYLYIEKTENGTTTRHYINSRSGYLFTVGDNQTLHLTNEAEAGNAPATNSDAETKTELLRLQWVYDVTGYFLLGTVTKDGAIAEDTTTEYLMPVQYDLDRATFGTDGKLKSVTEYDPSTKTYASSSLESYLKMLFEQYAAAYNSEVGYNEKTKHYGDYYAVDVDENGNGVWLYLADKAAIDAATAWDSAAAANTQSQNSTVKLIFKGQNQPSNK